MPSYLCVGNDITIDSTPRRTVRIAVTYAELSMGCSARAVRPLCVTAIGRSGRLGIGLRRGEEEKCTLIHNKFRALSSSCETLMPQATSCRQVPGLGTATDDGGTSHHDVRLLETRK